MKLFDKVPTPVLVLAAVGSVFFMGLDLLIFDPIPLIDEVFLLFLTASSTAELVSRYRGARSLPSPGGAGRVPFDSRARDEAVKTLTTRTTALLARARFLESQGHSPLVFQSLEPLPDRVEQMVRSSHDLEAFLTRSENDPWLVRQRLGRLERDISRAQTGRPTPRLERLRAQATELKKHELRVLTQIERRDDLASKLLALSQQVDALAADFRNIADDGILQGGWKVLKYPDLDPAIRDVVGGLEHLRVAEAEIEDVVRTHSPRPSATPEPAAS